MEPRWGFYPEAPRFEEPLHFLPAPRKTERRYPRAARKLRESARLHAPRGRLDLRRLECAGEASGNVAIAAHFARGILPVFAPNVGQIGGQKHNNLCIYLIYIDSLAEEISAMALFWSFSTSDNICANRLARSEMSCVTSSLSLNLPRSRQIVVSA